jgi:hypothetical protein
MLTHLRCPVNGNNVLPRAGQVDPFPSVMSYLLMIFPGATGNGDIDDPQRMQTPPSPLHPGEGAGGGRFIFLSLVSTLWPAACYMQRVPFIRFAFHLDGVFTS